MESIKIRGIIKTMMSNSRAIMTSEVTIKDILQLYKIDKEVNRDLNKARIPKLVKYIENQVSGAIYFPAFVFSFRGDPIKYYSKEHSNIELTSKEDLIIIDGQHRISALKRVLEKEDIENREDILNSTITCQIYFGLELEEEKQLFSDINSNTKKVSLSLITRYDTRDILNVLVSNLYKESRELKIVGVEMSKYKLYRPQNKKFLTGTRLKEYIIYLLFGKKTMNKNNEKFIKNNYDEILQFLKKYFYLVFLSIPDEPGDVNKYVLGHRSFQNAIALYSNKIIGKQQGEKLKLEHEWEEWIELLRDVDWRISNKVWEAYLIECKQGSSTYLGCVENIEKKILEKIEADII